MTLSPVLRRLVLTLGTLLLLAVAGELGVRFCPRLLGLDPGAIQRSRQFLLDGIAHYEARAHTVFQRPRGGEGVNDFGFSDGPWKRERTPGVARILCLGGSTTESGNPAGLQGSYPYLLERELEAGTGRAFEVFNAGISGWTSAEMLCSWFLTLADFHPDVLVLHEAVNDLPPRFRADFEPDYSHWRRPLDVQPARGMFRRFVRYSDLFVQLNLWRSGKTDVVAASTTPIRAMEARMGEGKLPPETSLPFRRHILDIASHAAQHGVRVVLMTLPARRAEPGLEYWNFGIEENNRHLRELCAEHDFLLADAEQLFAARPELVTHFLDLVHLDVPGNQAKAELLADTLAPWLSGLPSEDARLPLAR